MAAFIRHLMYIKPKAARIFMKRRIRVRNIMIREGYFPGNSRQTIHIPTGRMFSMKRMLTEMGSMRRMPMRMFPREAGNMIS